MIKNPNITSHLEDRAWLSIKDSLLGDALARNQVNRPPRLMTPPRDVHPISKPSNGGGVSAF